MHESGSEVEGEINGGVPCSCISDFMKNTRTKKFTKKQPTMQANPHVVVALGLQPRPLW